MKVESIRFDLVGAKEDDKFLKTVRYTTRGELLKFFLADGKSKDGINTLPRASWIPTVELQTSLKRIQLKIVNGRQKGDETAVARNELGTIESQIVNYLKAIDRFKVASMPAGLEGLGYMRPENLVGLGHDNFGWVSSEAAVLGDLGFYVTAPIPLASLLALVDIENDDKDLNNKVDPLFGNFTTHGSMFHIDGKHVETKTFRLADMKWVDDTAVGTAYGRNSVARLMMMLCLYTSKALSSPSDKDMDLKKLTPLMPRTDFTTTVSIVTDLMTSESAVLFRQNLVQIVASLTGKIDKHSGAWDLENWYFS